MDIKRLGLLMALLLMMLLPLQGLAAADNLLQNAGFDQLDGDRLPKGWQTGAYRTTEGYTVFSVTEEGLDGHAVMIQSFALNDARFAQTVKVEPSSIYRLSGYIKANDVAAEGWGANLSVEGVYISTDSVYETDDEWYYSEIYGKTGPKQKELTVFLRLGGYSGESSGVALFDDVELVKLNDAPSDVFIENWYREEVIQPIHQEPEADDTAAASPFWPWLLVISYVYLLGGCLMICQFAAVKAPVLSDSRRMPLFAIIGLLLSLILRLLIAYRVDGYQVDVNCFVSWGYTMQSAGPGNFYQSAWCDYPPGYMLLLGMNSWFSGILSNLTGYLPEVLQPILYHMTRPVVIIKLLPMLADLGIAVQIYHMAAECGMRRQHAGLLCLLTAFCPVLVINSAAWCQVDSVLALLLLAVVWLAIKRRWAVLMPVYMLSVLLKPQALMVGPLGLIVLLGEFVTADSNSRLGFRFKKPELGRDMLIGLGAALAVALAIVLPFCFSSSGLHLFNEDGSLWLIKLYADTLGSYPYATVNTANLYYLFNGNWSAIASTASVWTSLILMMLCLAWGAACAWYLRSTNRAWWWAESALMGAFALCYALFSILGVSWAAVGFVAMALAFAMVVPLYLRSGRIDLLPLMGGLLFLLIYVLGVKMHERYLFPAVALFAAAFAMRRDSRILVLMLLTACTMFINEGIVLDNSLRLGSSMGHLNMDTYALNMLLSALNLCSIPFALWTCAEICLTGRQRSFGLDHLPFTAKHEQRPARLANYQPDHRLHWNRLDTVLVLAITAVYAVLALWNLGSTKAPQTTWVSTAFDENIVLDLGEKQDNMTMLYFCQVSYNDFTVETSDDGEHWSEPYWAQMNEGSCYQWKYLTTSSVDYRGLRTYGDDRHYGSLQRLSGRYVRITAQQISLRLNEVIFRDADGQTIPAVVVARANENKESPMLSDPAAIIDEQDSLEGEPGWYTGTYFDEIYYARTAKELLDHSSPYEWTHPPLGKVFMSWMVSIFGLTPFGWRFAGALTGILMLPALYLLAKQLTKRTDLAALASSLLALDCMHFTQTRLATIDSYPVLFIILSYLFMVRFMQRDIVLTPVRRMLPDLALSGLFMGCGIASKWIGVYSGAGLAVLFFWTLARHIRLWLEAKQLAATDSSAAIQQRLRDTWLRLLVLCLWCVLFFIAVPAAVYALAYVPHFAYARPDGLGDFIRLLIREQQNMFNYHSQPGMGMDHQFYSPWYEWPANTRPMYYAMAAFQPAGMSQSIFCFSNPAVLWIGLTGLAFTCFLWLKRHLYSVHGSSLPVHLFSERWDIQPAVAIIGLLAQFLPWVLVPRGTYIYHFFASIPFLIICAVLSVDWLSKRLPRIVAAILALDVLIITLYVFSSSMIVLIVGGVISIALTVWMLLTKRAPKASVSLVALLILVSLAGFILCYPYASGMPASLKWLDHVKQFLNVYYHL